MGCSCNSTIFVRNFFIKYIINFIFFSVPISKDAFPLSCQKPCPALEANQHRQITPADKCTSGKSLFGTACTYSCDLSYSLNGPRSIVCMDDGTWSEIPPMCLVKCFHNATDRNSSSLPQYDGYPLVHDCIEKEQGETMINEGVQCRYSCENQFFRLNGPSVRTCTSSGYFDHILEPLCEFPNLGVGSVARYWWDTFSLSLEYLFIIGPKISELRYVHNLQECLIQLLHVFSEKQIRRRKGYVRSKLS